LHGPADDQDRAADHYDEVVAAHTDPDDFQSYTHDELDAHSAAIDALNAAFDSMTAAFFALDSSMENYSTVAALYKAYCDIQVFATRAYSYAAECAKITSLEEQIQTAKDECDLTLLQARMTSPYEQNASAVRARAAALKAKIDCNIAKATVLKEKATLSEVRAEELTLQAKSSQAIAEEILEHSGSNT
jgi:hypothetical protein